MKRNIIRLAAALAMLATAACDNQAQPHSPPDDRDDRPTMPQPGSDGPDQGVTVIDNPDGSQTVTICCMRPEPKDH